MISVIGLSASSSVPPDFPHTCIYFTGTLHALYPNINQFPIKN